VGTHRRSCLAQNPLILIDEIDKIGSGRGGQVGLCAPAAAARAAERRTRAVGGTGVARSIFRTGIGTVLNSEY
jgi:hypothetical protein